MTVGAERMQEEIESNRLRWQRKALLRAIYGRFYAAIGQRLRPGLTIEIGSGIGQIKEFLPDCITSDVFPNPGIDRVESAYGLSLEDGSVSNVVLFDVWHHLQFPGAALREFHRALTRGGRLIVFEPAMGLVPRLVYRLFHHEPLGFAEAIEWEPPPAADLRNPPYFAAQSRAWRLFVRGEADGRLSGWRVEECRTWSDLAYLASGGFSGPTLYPPMARGAIEQLDRLLTGMSTRLFAARMLVVLEKQ